MSNEPILSVKNLSVSFKIKAKLYSKKDERYKIAVDYVSFSIFEGKTFGIVGETGSGKSTIAKTLLGIYKPKAGNLKLMGREINLRNKKDLFFLRSHIGIVFQDPVSSLNPKLKLMEIIREGINRNSRLLRLNRKDQNDKIVEIADLVGLSENKLESYPAELSGGEKQRASLARAIVSKKEILILDEPTSSLDVSIQAQILNLLRKLKEELNLSYIFITHDLNVIKYMSDNIGILYYGQMLELGNVKDIFENPFHPYTSNLINANLTLKSTIDFNSRYDERGEPSREGCIYINSCPKKMPICEKTPPEINLNDRVVKCWLYDNQRIK
ncbi:MAG: ABC transporter ATP-binding protein [Candidatus Parvarchaeum sp.]